MLPQLKDGWIRVLAIDPSTSRMGVSVIDVNLEITSKFKLIWVETIHGDKLEHFQGTNYNDEQRVQSRIHGLGEAYGQLLSFFDPTVVCCEDNFLGPSADTFKRLVQAVEILRSKTEAYGNGLFMVNIPPKVAKETVGANFKGTQKEDVTKGILDYHNLEFNGFDITSLDEHSIDAIAINLTLCERIAKQRGKFNEREIKTE